MRLSDWCRGRPLPALRTVPDEVRDRHVAIWPEAGEWRVAWRYENGHLARWGGSLAGCQALRRAARQGWSAFSIEQLAGQSGMQKRGAK